MVRERAGVEHPPAAAGRRRARGRRAQAQQVDAERRVQRGDAPHAGLHPHRGAAGARPQRSAGIELGQRAARAQQHLAPVHADPRAAARCVQRPGPRHLHRAQAGQLDLAQPHGARGPGAGRKAGAEHGQAKAPRPHGPRQRHRAAGLHRQPPAGPAGPAQPHRAGPARGRGGGPKEQARELERAPAAPLDPGMLGGGPRPDAEPGRGRLAVEGARSPVARPVVKAPGRVEAAARAHAGEPVELGVARLERGVHPGVDRVVARHRTEQHALQPALGVLAVGGQLHERAAGLAVAAEGGVGARALEQPGEADPAQVAAGQRPSGEHRRAQRLAHLHPRDLDLAEAAAAAQVARRLVDLGDRHAQLVHVLGVQPDAVAPGADRRAHAVHLDLLLDPAPVPRAVAGRCRARRAGARSRSRSSACSAAGSGRPPRRWRGRRRRPRSPRARGTRAGRRCWGRAGSARRRGRPPSGRRCRARGRAR